MKPSVTLHEFMHGQFTAWVGIIYYQMTIKKGWVSDFVKPNCPNSNFGKFCMCIGANNDDQIWFHIWVTLRNITKDSKLTGQI